MIPENIEEEVTLEEAPIEEGFEESPEELDDLEEEAIGTITSHTLEEIPELEGLTIGDTITFRIANVDDNKFDLEVLESAPGEGEIESEIGGPEALTEKFI